MVPAAGVVVLFAELPLAGFDVVLVAGAPVEAVPLPVPVPEVLAGVEAGVAGNEVSGVGSGGSGLVRILASRSFRPVSWVSVAFRNLYHWVRLSFHCSFCLAYAESVPASATARA